MKQVATVLAILGCAAFAPAQAECRYPRAPTTLPDGKTATEAEMMKGMQDVKAYDKAVNEYLSCLDAEKQKQLTALGPDAPKEQIQQINAIHAKRYNAAVTDLEQRAALFNEQVRIYKNRNKN
jgi:hypothetical protein